MSAATAEATPRITTAESPPGLSPNGHSQSSLPTTPSTSTSLARINSGSAILSLAEKSGNPMQFLTEMGKQMAFSGMLGLRKPEQGSTLLLICMTENKTPLSIIQEYHLMDDGKMTKKADWVLSRFRELGGTYKIIKDGSDCDSASYEFAFRGNTHVVTYSMDDARREELVKEKSRWVKNPPSMLRARVITNGVRMLAPEVMAGFVCEEELEGQSQAPIAATAEVAETKRRKKTDVNAASYATQNTGDAIDAVVEQPSEGSAETGLEAATATAASTSTIDGDSANDATTILMEIELTLSSIGMTKADLEAGMKKKNPNFTTIDDLSVDQAKQILERLRAKKQASQPA